ncbi:MAG: DNA ligase D, partial [Polyangiaceae bacterium]|nr:DNA ligase D [Polyangiaceae bacterium]
RDFRRTEEPRGAKDIQSFALPGASEPRDQKRFVVQKHSASKLHFDLRLELGGALQSFAIPKEPSTDPGVKRLAVETETHPIEYLSFEGKIAPGNYGAGTMDLWDRGTFELVGKTEAEMRATGHFHLRFKGQRLEGDYHLVRAKEDRDAKGGAGKEGGAKKESKAWLFFRADPKGLLSKRQGALELARSAGEFARASVFPVHRPDDYTFEIKYDGYRLLAAKVGGNLALISRNRNDWTDRFPLVVEALRKIPEDSFVVDGELCAVDDAGIPSFGGLQKWLSGVRDRKISFTMFDVLRIGETDHRSKPIEERRELLAKLMAGAEPPLSVSSWIDGELETLLENARSAGLEGLIAKRKKSPYVSGHSNHWLKVKFQRRQEFAVVGWTPMEGTKDLGALLLAVAEGDRFFYCGKVGSGFDDEKRTSLLARLRALETSRPFAEGIPHLPTARFCFPELVVEVKYLEWTSAGHARNPVYLGTREDRVPTDCVREQLPGLGDMKGAANSESAAAEKEFDNAPRIVPVKVTNPDKILFPKLRLPKKALVDYYDRVAPWMLPHLAGRPVHLQRYPDGVGAKEWYQHRCPPNPPAFVRRLPFEDTERIIIENRETLLWCANLAALTLHTWNSRAPLRFRNETELTMALDTPDYVVMDLDPPDDSETSWGHTVEIANAIRGLLEALELRSFVKTTGGSGLHIVAPLKAPVTHKQVTAFSKSISLAVSRVLPAIATSELSKDKRKGRVLVDTAPNGHGKTMVAPYTVRASEEASISMPLEWSELSAAKGPKSYTMLNAIERLERVGDSFANVLAEGGTLPSAR